MRYLIPTLLALCSCSLAHAGQRVSVHDGDTLRVDGQRWRLWGVDAPELDQTCGRQPCGEQARDALSDLVAGHVVVCEARGRSYDRLVGVCSAGGIDLGAAMVRKGWALDYRRFSGGAYNVLESAARTETRGIWSSTFTAPWLWRIQQGRGRR